jgi:hypothetical protein
MDITETDDDGVGLIWLRNRVQLGVPVDTEKNLWALKSRKFLDQPSNLVNVQSQKGIPIVQPVFFS